MKMKRTSLIVVSGVLATALVAGSIAIAKPHRGFHQMMPSFEMLDQNNDGEVTKDEVRQYAKTRFDATDANKDGLLSKEEIQARANDEMKKKMSKRFDRMMSKMDSNEDGKLSFEELQARSKRPEKIFDRMDADENGSISRAEFEKLKEKRKSWGKGKRYDDRGHDGDANQDS